MPARSGPMDERSRVIETLMVFALGFLAASLGGLLVLPAVNARAARLARRRAEAVVPLSPVEIAAERDFLRAQFAVQQRRLERRVEAVQARRHADMAAIGARTMEAAALARTVSAREADLAEASRLRTRLEGELETAREDGSASLATLLALEEAHADLLDGLLAARREREAVRLPSPEAETAAEVETLRASLSAAEHALAQALAARGEGIERENAELRRRIGEVADVLTRRERLPAVAAFPASAQA